MRPGARHVLVLLLALPLPAHAQTMRDRLLALFTFGSCGQPLCLSVDAGIHQKHFIPSVVEGADNILAFLTNAVGTSVGNVPVSAASGGKTFTFAGGTPVATSTSAGPIFAERAQTLGRGRWFVGGTVTGVDFKSIGGIPLNDLNFNFTHQNVADPALGNPPLENDLLQVNTAVNVNLVVTSVALAYGLLDHVDLAVDVPLMHSSISGHSTATIVPYTRGLDSLAHYFGSATDRQLSATTTSSGSASGIGDVVGRIKVNVVQKQDVGLAFLAGARFPTGNQDQFLGTGGTDIMGMGILSGRLSTLSPHLNLGYVHRGADFATSAMLATVGVDNLVGSRATIALDLITSWQVGASKLVLPGPVTYTQPITRTVRLTDIPDERDNQINAAIGTKIAASNRLNLVANSFLPVNRRGVRADVVWTLGLEYNFYPRRTSVVSAP